MTEENALRKLSDAREENVVKNAAHVIKICRAYLRILGIWKDIDGGVFFWRTILRYASITVCCFLIGIRGIPIGLYLILDEKRPIERLRIGVRFSFTVMKTYMYCSLLSNRENIEKFMKHIQVDWLKADTTACKNIMLRHSRLGLRLTTFYAILTYMSTIFLTVLPIIARKIRVNKAHSMNATIMVSSRRFAVPSHFGSSVFSETPFYEIIYTSQMISIFMLHSIAIAFYSLVVVVVTHACGQLRIVIGKLDDLIDGGGKMSMCNSIDGRMTEIIRHHVRTLRFIALGDKVFRGICFGEIGNYTVFLCVLAYFCLLEFQNENKQLIALIGWSAAFVNSVFKAFALCYIGELLSQEYVNVGKGTCMVEWYRLPGKKSLDLGLIITMARNPVTLTAGGQFQLSIKCFATIMQSTLGYINMLRTVMD